MINTKGDGDELEPASRTENRSGGTGARAGERSLGSGAEEPRPPGEAVVTTLQPARVQGVLAPAHPNVRARIVPCVPCVCDVHVRDVHVCDVSAVLLTVTVIPYTDCRCCADIAVVLATSVIE